MNDTTKMILVGLIGILVGVSATLLSFGGNGFGRYETGRKGDDFGHTCSKNERGEMGKGMKNEMNGMMQGIAGKTGDEFDEAFLNQMIMHHEGAVQMAELAQKSAQRVEIKDLSTKIISAQKEEITQMKKWTSEWYGQ